MKSTLQKIAVLPNLSFFIGHGYMKIMSYKIINIKRKLNS